MIPLVQARRRRRCIAGGDDYLLRDAFPEADGVDLNGKVLQGAGTWTVHVGSFDVNGNRARVTGTASNHATADAGTPQRTAQVIVNRGTINHDLGLSVRGVDQNNYWLLDFDNSVGRLDLYEINAGTFTLRASFTTTFTASTDFTLKVTDDGANLYGFLDGVQRVTYASTLHAAGTRYGIFEGGATSSTGGKFDDFQVLR